MEITEEVYKRQRKFYMNLGALSAKLDTKPIIKLDQEEESDDELKDLLTYAKQVFTQ